MEAKRKEHITKLAVFRKRLGSDTLFGSWCYWIANALKAEHEFKDELELCGKAVMVHLDGLDQLDPVTSTKGEVVAWCLKTYDVYHMLRNNVETIDSIDSVNEYFKLKLYEN